MFDVRAPRWADVEEVVRMATDSLLVCSPYFTLAGLDRILDGFGGDRLDFWTRLSPTDWVNGVSEPDDLSAMLDLLAERAAVELRVGQRLHAKAYVADDQLALIGSANLTAGGFASNVELVVRIEGELAPAASEVVRRTCRPASVISLDSLREWVARYGPAVVAASNEQRQSMLPEDLAPAQQALDEMLGLGHSEVDLPGFDRADLEDFIRWMAMRPDLAGATVVHARATNADGSNLTGHVKQSFFALMRFLTEHPRWVDQLRGSLRDLEPDDIYTADDPDLPEAWNDHLDGHATDTGEIWSYPTLRGILPPAYGGTREGGGGGISTLKRMFPLVAEFSITR